MKKSLRRLYMPSPKEFVLVDVPLQRFLAIDGQGDPNTSTDYAEAVEALYSVSYTVKFASKKKLERDFVVAPLEGLWWADDPETFRAGDKSAWKWTMMICQPDWVTEEIITDATAAASRKKQLPAISRIELRELGEGLSVQILHIGSYDDEAPTLARLHDEFMPANGLDFNGHHHEIYLSDPRRTDPAKLRTVLRQPVRRQQP